MSYRVSNALEGRTAGPVTAIVGCGGTGGFVAEGVCRLLGNQEMVVTLIDHDRVEEHNLRRQAFYPGDVGRFKAEVLAERLARSFGREIGYSVYPYTGALHHELFQYGRGGIVIGCVDNAAARREIAEAVQDSQWWIDAGNGEYSGQVLIGNTRTVDHLKGSFVEEDEICHKLPLPSLQQPALLVPAPEPTSQPDCAEAVEAGQSSTINQAMAVLTLEFVSRLMGGTLTWMGAYLDLEVGTLRPVPIEPKTVARMVGLRVKDLMAKKKKPEELPPVCPRCGRRHW